MTIHAATAAARAVWAVLLFAIAAPCSTALAEPAPFAAEIEIRFGTLPPITATLAWVGDRTGGVVSIPPLVATPSPIFVPVTGFPLNLITGLEVLQLSVAGGALAAPQPSYCPGPVCVFGGGFGGSIPVRGLVQVSGALALNVPLSAIGSASTVSVGSPPIVIRGAPFTTGTVRVETTGAPMVPFFRQGDAVGTPGVPDSIVNLVSPAHLNAAGLARLPVFASLRLRFVEADADTDGDGVKDGTDNCRGVPNADQVDVDLDRVGDACDNCPTSPNFDQVDLDADGVGDACDLDIDGDGFENEADACPRVIDLAQRDTDGDRIGDACDVCPQVPDPLQRDADHDGIGDACDACPSLGGVDPDGDGLCSDVDNCPEVANADQADADGDGLGDVCDACPVDAENDFDGDGTCAAADNCPFIANPGQQDTDGDGVGDACDNCPFAPNPGQENLGAVGFDAFDAIGDACQCGDVSGDGRVTARDAVLILRALLNPAVEPLPHPERCDVGASVGCTLADAVVIRRALLEPPQATLAQACAPAQP